MLEKLKAQVASASGILAHPKVQGVIQRVVHMRADFIDQFDERLSGVAKRFNLATRSELKSLRRQVRELENQVATLEHQLSQERLRADRAEVSLSDALKSAKKPVAEVKPAPAKVEATAPPKAVEAPKVAKVEAPKPEAPKAEAAAKPEAPKAEAPKAKAPKAEAAAKPEAPKPEAAAKPEALKLEPDDAGADKPASRKFPRPPKKGADPDGGAPNES